MIQLEINLSIDQKNENKLHLDFNVLKREDANPLEKKFMKIFEKFIVNIMKDLLIDGGAKLGIDEKIKAYAPKQDAPHD
jgi:hypothetical protein